MLFRRGCFVWGGGGRHFSGDFRVFVKNQITVYDSSKVPICRGSHPSKLTDVSVKVQFQTDPKKTLSTKAGTNE